MKNNTFIAILKHENDLYTQAILYFDYLSYYNDISSIKLGDKLIVPTSKK